MDGESRFSAIFGQLRTLSDPLIILVVRNADHASVDLPMDRFAEDPLRD